MSNVTVNNKSYRKSISVIIDGEAKSPNIPARGSGTYPLFEVNPASSVLQLAMKNPDSGKVYGKPVVLVPLPSSIAVPPIDPNLNGTGWTLTFSRKTTAKEDQNVNVTVGQDIPPVQSIISNAAAWAMIGWGAGMLLGHFVHNLSPLLWGGLSAIAIIAGIITGILACKKETPQDDTTQTK